MALSFDKARHTMRPDDSRKKHMNVAANQRIYKGAIVALDGSGDITPAPASQDQPFAGIAWVEYDNSSNGSATTDTPLQVEYGQIERLKYQPGGATDALLDTVVYFFDDEQVTDTVPSDTTTRVGRIYNVHSATEVDVDTSFSGLSN